MVKEVYFVRTIGFDGSEKDKTFLVKENAVSYYELCLGYERFKRVELHQSELKRIDFNELC